MNEFSVKIYPSDLPSDEKERRLWDVLEFLLRSKKQEGNEKKRARGKRGETADDSARAFPNSFPQLIADTMSDN